MIILSELAMRKYYPDHLLSCFKMRAKDKCSLMIFYITNGMKIKCLIPIAYFCWKCQFWQQKYTRGHRRRDLYYIKLYFNIYNQRTLHQYTISNRWMNRLWSWWINYRTHGEFPSIGKSEDLFLPTHMNPIYIWVALSAPKNSSIFQFPKKLVVIWGILWKTKSDEQ